MKHLSQCLCICCFFLSDKRALIVYPQGCYEVEKLVLFLVKQLNCIGIYPLTDLTQGQRVGEEGETVVMINDFEKATYIIILCTDGLCKYSLVLSRLLCRGR